MLWAWQREISGTLKVCQTFVLTDWERPAFLTPFTLHRTAGVSAMHATQWHRHPQGCRAKDPWDNFTGCVHSCPSGQDHLPPPDKSFPADPCSFHRNHLPTCSI